MLTSDEFLIFCITVREKDVLHVPLTCLSEDSKSQMKTVVKTKTLSFPAVLTFTAKH